ncbi:superoxide dismutase family protein [Streptosporangium sp. NPDC023615]|uniref:superoxide dismutase family protein n=1 Tax=Streptosporangium sp. NPDC023615 TaxID=3154794 RepID=UPI003412FFA5
MRTLGVLVIAAVLFCAGCGDQVVAQHSPGHRPSPGSSGGAGGVTDAGIRLTGGGTLVAPAPRASAIVYDTALVPPGAEVTVTAESGAVLSTSTVVVKGMLPARTYGVHLHVDPCGLKPDDAGAHYRSAHSHTDAQASAENEVWLDLTTDARGDATATTTQDWAFSAGRPPGSLVIHAEPTRTAGTEAGSAGSRVACVTLVKR